jgi:hypothetical protein
MHTLLLPLTHTNTNFYIAPVTLKFYLVELVIQPLEGEADMLFLSGAIAKEDEYIRGWYSDVYK